MSHLTAAALVVASLVRLTIRDGYPLASTVFYATPWPVLPSLAAAVSIFSFYRKRTWAACAAGVVALAWGVCGFAIVYYDNPAVAPNPSDIRIVFWNVAHPTTRLPRILARLGAHDADIIAVGEADALTPSLRRIWQKTFAGYRLVHHVGKMLVLTTGEILEEERGSLGGRSAYLLVGIRIRDVIYRVLLVDFASGPFGSRRRPFKRLLNMINQHAGENLIVLGDFNTPLDSVYFDPLRARLTHAFEAGGRGYSATWPVPVPVTALDHVWLGRSIAVTGCSLDWSVLSDHRLIEVRWVGASVASRETGRAIRTP